MKRIDMNEVRKSFQQGAEESTELGKLHQVAVEGFQSVPGYTIGVVMEYSTGHQEFDIMGNHGTMSIAYYGNLGRYLIGAPAGMNLTTEDLCAPNAEQAARVIGRFKGYVQTARVPL